MIGDAVSEGSQWTHKRTTLCYQFQLPGISGRPVSRIFGATSELCGATAEFDMSDFVLSLKNLRGSAQEQDVTIGKLVLPTIYIR